jgi:hypothetical protein
MGGTRFRCKGSVGRAHKPRISHVEGVLRDGTRILPPLWAICWAVASA